MKTDYTVWTPEQTDQRHRYMNDCAAQGIRVALEIAWQAGPDGPDLRYLTVAHRKGKQSEPVIWLPEAAPPPPEVASSSSLKVRIMRDVTPHDCDEHAVAVATDGPLGHGWECGLCGKFLQAG